MSLLFDYFGVKNDEEIIKLCNPEGDEEFDLFLIDIFRNGKVHREVMKNKRNYDSKDALKLIAELISKG